MGPFVEMVKVLKRNSDMLEQEKEINTLLKAANEAGFKLNKIFKTKNMLQFYFMSYFEPIEEEVDGD